MKKLRGIIGGTLLLMISVMLSFAVQASSLTVEVPVSVTVDGAAPATPEAYQISLQAQDTSNPMPEGAVEGRYQTEIVGAGAARLSMTFDRAGEYAYTVSQIAGSAANAVYDEKVYTLMVTITTPENGEGLESTVALHPGAEAVKSDAVYFKNYYKTSEVSMVKVLLNKGSGKDGAFREGEIVRFAVTVTNNGETDVTNVTVTEQLKDAFFSEEEGITLNETKDQAVIAVLAKGESAVLQVTYTVKAADVEKVKIKNIVTGVYQPAGPDKEKKIPDAEAEFEVDEPETEPTSETETETEPHSETEPETKPSNNHHTPKNGFSPLTGDNAPIMMYTAALAAALVILIIAVVIVRRRKNRK
ncbi:MAG: FctA domain-containing protein [Eubacteriales bacterium]|nr:FctA domain-containing protein [Eubacteriales bacterium]